jgi:thiol-disulfide isomerase/thioredoxin
MASMASAATRRWGVSRAAWRGLVAICLGAAGAAFAGSGVAWLPASTDADIDRAFGRARSENKPVLLYWGARWCPPCNQLKATLFERQDFVERSRAFVAVAIDGDDAGAQRLGTRFKVRGYPTLVVLDPAGREMTRLPGEAEPAQILGLMQQGLAGGRAFRDVLADARAGRALTAGEWRLLAFSDWETGVDDGAEGSAAGGANGSVSAADRPGLLYDLSLRCPPGEADLGARLMLKALAETDDGKGVVADAGLRERVAALLADARARRALSDLIVNSAAEIARALAPDPGPARERVVAGFDAALVALQADTSLSRADRQSALIGRVELARMDLPRDEVHPVLSAELQQQVRDEALRNDREITDGYERQAVITAAAYMLSRADLWQASDELLRANLARSHSPYYLMSELARNARALGRTEEGLGWYQRAWERSEGPSTRLQWGTAYLGALIELAPDDAPRIESLARRLIGEARRLSDAFQERNRRSLVRIVDRLARWGKTPARSATVVRVRLDLAGLCRSLPPDEGQRRDCDALARKGA